MIRRELPLDARRIVQVLAEYAVHYIVIGGLAVQAHGHTTLRAQRGWARVA